MEERGEREGLWLENVSEYMTHPNRNVIVKVITFISQYIPIKYFDSEKERN